MSTMFRRLAPVIAAGSCCSSRCQAQKYKCGFHSERTTNDKGQLRSRMQPKLKYSAIVNVVQQKKKIIQIMLKKSPHFWSALPKIHRADKMPTSGKVLLRLSTLTYMTYMGTL